MGSALEQIASWNSLSTSEAPAAEPPPASFIDSPFPCKADYDACLKLPADARAVVWAAAAEAQR